MKLNWRKASVGRQACIVVGRAVRNTRASASQAHLSPAELLLLPLSLNSRMLPPLSNPAPARQTYLSRALPSSAHSPTIFPKPDAFLVGNGDDKGTPPSDATARWELPAVRGAMDVGVGVEEEEEDAEVRRMLVARARGCGLLAAVDAASSLRQEADEGESCLHIALCRLPVRVCVGFV